MQPTFTYLELMRSKYVTDSGIIFGTHDPSKSNNAYHKQGSQKVDKAPTQDTLEIGNK